MILKKLIVQNFRVFQGIHEFDLAPRNDAPIILFGGLNGAGKTTTLTAIRLALYGRQFLGIGTSQKNYNNYLKDSIHNCKLTGKKSENASVELIFTYASLGIINEYHVKRKWAVVNNNITEDLIILQNNNLVENLSYEQSQGFLNELIPIGVSDLFFFDGEKISQLAEDDDGNALSDSVKKLIGLDTIDKLMADITVFVRNKNKLQMPDEIKAKIKNLETILETQEVLIQIQIQEYEELKKEQINSDKIIDLLTNNLNTYGGAWAASREEEISKVSELNVTKENIEQQIIEIISKDFPFSIAQVFILKCIEQLDKELKFKKNKNIQAALSEHVLSLEDRLSNILDEVSFLKVSKEIGEEFNKFLSPIQQINIIHDVSETTHHKIISIAVDGANKQKEKIANLTLALSNTKQKIDDIGVNIARAPDQNLLTIRLKELTDAQAKNSLIISEITKKKENIRVHLRDAIKTVKNLEKLHENYISSDDNDRALTYAHQAGKALTKFSELITVNKIKNVEMEFVNSFMLLARKEDEKIRALIDPQTFHVKLINEFGNIIPKDSLSAGERQIYAVAMLNALAKTSGRKLPIIIDTPLGRLDSKHRSKLIDNYFPYASHQVIILSTDTEIGVSYLAKLKKHISHSIMLDYSNDKGSSYVGEGYFWKNEN
jgi:DNA sulfur modification protein DndD